MANPEHVAKLKEGAEAWNQWRDEHPRIVPDLSDADLPEADLITANLTDADLTRANLAGAYLIGASLNNAKLAGANAAGADLTEGNLIDAILSGANLVLANLTDADLTRANFAGSNLERANLVGTDLSGSDLAGSRLKKASLISSDLTGADLSEAILTDADLGAANLASANFAKANLSGALLQDTSFSRTDLADSDFSGAVMRATTLCDVDLSMVKGLDRVEHQGPSTIGIDTIYRSKGRISEVFLRGSGTPEGFIVYMRSLAGQPVDFYSCFISYSSEDDDFAKRIYGSLQAHNVRCWFAPEDLKIGDRFQEEIEKSIRVYDKLLVVLSQNSVSSRWVEREVQAAFEKEQRLSVSALFPVRLDDAVMDCPLAWAADIRRTRHIGDFRKWKDHDSFQKSLDRLLRDLKSQDSKPK